MNSESHSQSYRASGVDITRGYRAVDLMRPFVESTRTPGVADAIGGFGGLFRPDLTGICEPVLVSGTDGVGTKLKLAFLLDRHDTVGCDCVAMCVNDIVCCGAKPLFFLDYIACGRLDPEKAASIVSGVAEGCRQSGAALVGGETAEMPGFYPPEEYDLAGFAVGIADRSKLLDKNEMRPGDVLLALPSSGVHSNGFSLVRKVFRIGEGGKNRKYEELEAPLWETLLTPTRIYVKAVAALLAAVRPRSLAHITGGGFFENIPRALAEGCRARIERKAVRTPPVFGILQREGNIPERDMFNTFNMGVGMTVVVPKTEADAALAVLKENGEDAYIIGETVESDEGVILC